MPTFPKTPAQLQRIRAAIKDNFLFKNLDEEQEHDVLTAMREVNIPAKEAIIQQGDAGDYFYIVEKGELEVYVKKDGQMLDPSAGDSETLGKKVVVYHEGASFGELALMHKYVIHISTMADHTVLPVPPPSCLLPLVRFGLLTVFPSAPFCLT